MKRLRDMFLEARASSLVEGVENAAPAHGIPQVFYTDALCLFGPSSSHDHLDPRSEFQRALRALGIAHLVAPTPQAKGKIERRFSTLQKRLVTLLAHAKVTPTPTPTQSSKWKSPARTPKKNSSTGEIPQDLFEASKIQPHAALRTCPPAPLLDLHLSLRTTRKVSSVKTFEFEGGTYQIAPTLKKTVTILYHPKTKFWALEEPPKLIWQNTLSQFSL